MSSHKVIYYTTNVWEGVDQDKRYDGRNFAQDVAMTLNDPRGWRKYGYVFVNGEKPGAIKRTLVINLVPQGNPKGDPLMDPKDVPTDNLKKLCGSTGKLSCYDPAKYQIFVNYNNWTGGSQSTLPIERYRNYVINHEVGHALGLNHPKVIKLGDREMYYACSKASSPQGGSVMMQMSKGPKLISPCLENEWPLDVHVYDEMQNMAPGYVEYFVSSAVQTAGSFSNLLMILLIIALVCLGLSLGVKVLNSHVSASVNSCKCGCDKKS